MILHHVTHAEVAVDPAIPVPGRRLSDLGRARAARAAALPRLAAVDRVAFDLSACRPIHPWRPFDH